MTEKDIVRLLEFHSTKDYMYVSNSFVFSEESDFLSFSYQDIAHEFEIKVSRTDYFKDFKKRKHRLMEMLTDKKTAPYDEKAVIKDLPNKFSFIVPEGLIDKSEVPKYAGLYHVIQSEGGATIKCMKRPKTLHKEKFNQWRYLANKLFWQNRKRK